MTALIPSEVVFRPYAIPHDQYGAGLRDYFPLEVTPARPPHNWTALLILVFFAGVAIGFVCAS